MKSTLKKKSLEESLSGHTAQVIESEGKVETIKPVRESNIMDAFMVHEMLVNLSSGFTPSFRKNKSMREKFVCGEHKFTPLLTPMELSAFSTLVVAQNIDEGKRFYELDLTLSRLVQHSYNCGHNNFKFDFLGTFKEPLAFSFLKGRKDNPLVLSAQGDFSKDSFSFLENSILNLKGKFEHSTAKSSKNCVFFIEGDTCAYLGSGAKDSIFHLKSNTGINLGNGSSNSSYFLDGDFGNYVGTSAKNSLFVLKGNGGSLGPHDVNNPSVSCQFYVEGDIPGDVGLGAKSSLYHIKGNVGGSMMICAKESTLYLNGESEKIPSFIGNNSTFITPNKSLLEKCVNSSEAYNSKWKLRSGKIIFQNSKGEFELVRDYSE